MEENERTTKLILRFIKRNLVLLFSIVVFVFLFFYFTIHAAGPWGSDELLYADAGLRGYGNYIVMNRYTHIYLQLFFMSLAPTPLIGMRFFWGFIMSVTSVSVFLLGRYITTKSNFIHGIFALLIFLATNLFWLYFGVPIVDLTAMMMVTIYLLVLVYFMRRNQAKWVVVLLGFLFFFSFKTKEFAVILLVTLPIFGFEEPRVFKFRRLLSFILYYLLGIGVGVLLFIGLNAIVINDPLFGLRFSDWITFRQTIASFTHLKPDPDSYLKKLMFSVFYLPFTLYLLGAIKKRDSISTAEYFIWLSPLIYIVMMTLTMIQSGWRTDERYIYPIIALVCALAPQFFTFPLPENRKEWIKFSIYLASAVIGFLLIRQSIYWFTSLIQMSFSSFVLNYVLDIFFLILLGGMILIHDEKLPNSAVLIFFLIMNLYFPLSINVKTSMRGDNAEKVSKRFAPISAFRGEGNICETTTIEMTPQVLDAMRIGPDPNEAAAMVNVFYDYRLPNNGFGFFDENTPLIDSLQESNADYILMGASEWQKIMQYNPDFELERYSLIHEPLDKYVLLESIDKTTCP
ncbi:MAG: hypothetical protein SVR81_06010 [Chloroflexota bacterium]|nr:hypothetical protein [Chloroflexota bacterium]